MNRSGNPTDTQAIADAVTAERLALCDLLDQLGPDEWQTPSLCSGWTVQDVVAHLTLATHETTRDMIVGLVRAHGSFDRMTRDTAIERAHQFDPPTLIEQMRQTADSTRRAPMSSPLDPLTDILVHTQDVARPLGRTYAADPERVMPALTHAVDSRWYGGMKRFTGLTLVASDTTWTAGAGEQEVEGAATDLLLMATGRPVGLAGLTGTGVDTLASRVARK